MAEVQNISGKIDVEGDGEEASVVDMGGALAEAPGIKQGQEAIDIVKGIWEDFPEDPDGAEVAGHALDTVSSMGSFVAECSTEAATAVLDPLGWLVDNGLEMVLHLVTPLQDALHQVTGDGPRLTTAGEDFTAIAQGFVDYSEEFVRVTQEALKDWHGDASDAAQTSLKNFAVGMQGVATSAGGVAEVLKSSAMLMQVIEDVIKAIISELVQTLIMIWLPALATSIISLGSSVAGAMAASAAKAAAAFSRVTSKMGKLGQVLQKIMEFFQKLGRKMVDLGKKLGATEGKTLDNVESITSTVNATSRRAATKEAFTTGLKESAKEQAKEIPTKISEGVLGIDVTPAMKGESLAENGWDAANKLNNVYQKARDNTSHRVGSGESAEETERRLDM